MQKETSNPLPEKSLALIHRVIVPDTDYPKEYSILVTDRRLIFIRLEKTRSSFALRGEMRFGTALVTDIVPKTLEDYSQTRIESLTGDGMNINVPLERVISLEAKTEEVKFRWYEFWVRLTMKRQGGKFQVYHFDLNYRRNTSEARLRCYMVPLGAYFKPRRMATARDAILRDYALEALETLRQVLPAKTLTFDEGLRVGR